MKDVFSKATFGFLMAQFMPGVIAAMGVVLLYYSFTGAASDSDSKLDTAEKIYAATLATWEKGPLVRQVVLLGLCTGLGMLIHGLHWAVLGFLEFHYPEKDEKGQRLPGVVFKTYGHELPIAIQILIGPFKAILEMIQFLVQGRKIADIAIEENAPDIPKDKWEAFQYVQDFYMHFAQFYAHTAYALIIVWIGLWHLGYSSRGQVCPSGAVLALYLLSGLFFTIGRIQIASWFTADHKVKTKTKTKTKAKA